MGSVKSKRNTGDPFYVRRAHHAGSWYDDTPGALDEALSRYLQQAGRSKQEDETTPRPVMRGLVVPHAGYSYSGPTAAYAYRELIAALSSSSSQEIETIVVLHPSHHVYLKACAVSGATELETPLGNLTVNASLRQEVQQLGPLFENVMTAEMDEEEHSGEMQYPYICKALSFADTTTQNNVTVLPIMVGALDHRLEQQAGTLLAPILARPGIVTIVSSDFCHWGTRFQFQPTGVNGTQIFKHVEDMDRAGMHHIEMQEPGAFAKYLKQTSNTICGRHAIAVWLNAIRRNRDSGVECLDVNFVRYEQSAQARTMNDSSVSYASGVATLSRTC